MIRISKIEFQYNNIPTRRRIKVCFNDGCRAYISPCHESWEQWGTDIDHFRVSFPIAVEFNYWLHGKTL